MEDSAVSAICCDVPQDFSSRLLVDLNRRYLPLHLTLLSLRTIVFRQAVYFQDQALWSIARAIRRLEEVCINLVQVEERPEADK